MFFAKWRKEEAIAAQRLARQSMELSVVTNTLTSLEEKKQEFAASEGETIKELAKIEEVFEGVRTNTEKLSNKMNEFYRCLPEYNTELCEKAEEIRTDLENQQCYYEELYQGVMEFKGKIQQKNTVFEETDHLLMQLDEVLTTLEHSIQGK